MVAEDWAMQGASALAATCRSWYWVLTYPDSKFHEANMGPIWGRQEPGGPHVGPMNLVIWVVIPEYCCFSTRRLNSLWTSDIWRYRTGSTLAQVMACCLATLSHYMNHCWLIICKIQWHSSEGNEFIMYAVLFQVDLVRAIVDEDLGFVVSSQNVLDRCKVRGIMNWSETWDQTSKKDRISRLLLYVKKKRFEDICNDHWFINYILSFQTFLFISDDKRVVGCCIAEAISKVSIQG